MAELVSQAEAARRFGVSQPAISKLVKQGKLPLVKGKVHMEMAEAILSQKLDPARSKILQGRQLAANESAAITGENAGNRPASFIDYGEAKARREHHEANLAELRSRKLAGELVEREAVERAAYRVGRMIRDAVLGVPPKIATDLVNAADHWEAQQILTKALRQVLDDASKLSTADLEREMGA